MSSTVAVHLSHHGSLKLRLYQRVKGEFGLEAMRPDGDAIELHPGNNSGMSAEFFEKWAQQNENNPIRLLFSVQPEERE